MKRATKQSITPPNPCELINRRNSANESSVEYLVKTTGAMKGLTRRKGRKGGPLGNVPDGKYLYIISGDSPSTIQYVDMKLEKTQKVKHPGISEAHRRTSPKRKGSGDVLMAGEFIKKGDVIKINNSSGHYAPSPHCNDYLKWLMTEHYGLTLIKETSRNKLIW